MTAYRQAPAPRRPHEDEPQLPVFVDESGWRRRALQGIALVVGCVCLGYLFFVGVLGSGLLQPVGTQPPSVKGPAAPDDTGSTSPRRPGHRSGGSVRAEARQASAEKRAERTEHAERTGRTGRAERAERAEHEQRAEREQRTERDRHRRPPAGRSAPPPAGGARQ
ncbi:hypothetical protein [Streptomyces silaceus]|uniref:hypothetical protein n=1 Tax=Streptomyces silaceus TaxID=545123 RepID=UPI000A535E74|nr:hypothetical protein [Streptomyces silaceus]